MEPERSKGLAQTQPTEPKKSLEQGGEGVTRHFCLSMANSAGKPYLVAKLRNQEESEILLLPAKLQFKPQGYTREQG